MTSLSNRRVLLLGAVGFAVVIALRKAFFLSLGEVPDLQRWREFVSALERGESLYGPSVRYIYTPVWAEFLWLLRLVTKPLGLGLSQAVSLVVLLAYLATAALLFQIIRQRRKSVPLALLVALLFFANPVSVLVSSSLGMFDNIAILFLLLAISFSDKRPVPKAAVVAALTASLLIKHVAWFHPLLLVRRVREPRVGLFGSFLPYALFFASFLPFWRDRALIRARVFGYNSLDEPYGMEFLRFVKGMPPWAPTALLLVAALTAAFALRRIEFGRGCLLLFLVVLIFSPGIVQYYFVWPIALGALYPSAGYAVYTAMVGAFLIHSPDALAQEIPHLPGWNGPWWALVFWLLWEIRLQSKVQARESGIRT